MGFYTRKKRHFRGHKTNVKGKTVIHPSYIVGEEDNHYLFFGVTHSPKKGKGHSNYRLSRNPDSKDSRVAYLRKHLEADRKQQFTHRAYVGYRMSAKDEAYVDGLIAKRCKKDK